MTTAAPRPTLSVLIPNYNHARFLPESLGAILAQSYQPSEIIVLDDASTDNSVGLIESFARRDPRVQLVRNGRNMGVEYSVNRLLELASGEYVYSPSADDRVLPGFFEKSMALLARHPEAALCSTVGRLIGKHGEDRGIRALPVISSIPGFFPPEDVRKKLIRYGRWIDAGSVIYRLDALKREGGYIQELGSFADTFANLVLALRYGACFVPEPLHCWRQMADGYASTTAGDLERLAALGERALGLMRTEYRELFPLAYVRAFDRHWRYSLGVVAGQHLTARQEKVLNEARRLVLDHGSLCDRWFLAAVRCGFLATRLSWRVYLMARLGTWRWWLLGRLSIVLNLREVVLRDKFER